MKLFKIFIVLNFIIHFVKNVSFTYKLFGNNLLVKDLRRDGLSKKLDKSQSGEENEYNFKIRLNTTSIFQKMNINNDHSKKSDALLNNLRTKKFKNEKLEKVQSNLKDLISNINSETIYKGNCYINIGSKYFDLYPANSREK